LRGFDLDLRDGLLASMQKRGIRVLLGCQFTSIGKRGNCLHAETNHGDVVEADQIMLAIGRQPNTMALHTGKAGIRLGRKGEIVVDEFSATNVPHIHAIGDVDRPMR